MPGKGGQLKTHGDSLGGQIVRTGASCAVQLVKMLLFLGSRIDTAPVWHIELAKIGYQIGENMVSNDSPRSSSRECIWIPLIRLTAARLMREMVGPQFLVVF